MEETIGATGLSLSMEDRGSKKRAMEERRLALGTSSIGYNMMTEERRRMRTAICRDEERRKRKHLELAERRRSFTGIRESPP
jgi:hypothetical protein